MSRRYQQRDFEPGDRIVVRSAHGMPIEVTVVHRLWPGQPGVVLAATDDGDQRVWRSVQVLGFVDGNGDLVTWPDRRPLDRIDE